MAPDKEQIDAASGEKEYLTVDDHYCNPDAKIVLISKEKMAFKIDAWLMSRQSEFIRNLLSVPSEQSIETAPIHLDHSNDVVRYFLDSLTPSPSAEMLVKVELCTDLLKLSDMFGTPQVERNILNSMRVAMTFEKGREPPRDAWGGFKVAAERDSVALAQAAVRCLGLSGHSIRDILLRKTPSYVDGIPPRYLYALFRCSLQSTPRDSMRPEYSQQSRDSLDTRDWESAARFCNLH